MPRLKLALAGLLFASPAFAQVGGGADMNGGMGGGGTPVAGGGATAGAATGEAVGMEPKSIIDRSYVIMPGKLEAEAQYLVYSISSSFFNPLTMMTETRTSRFDGLEVGGAYGIADKLNAGLLYGFGTGFVGDNDFEIGEGGLALFGNYELVHDKDMTVAGSFDLSLDLCGSRDMAMDCVITKELHLGAGARFNLTPQVAVFTGAPYGPGLIGQQLSISLEDGNLTTLTLPVGGMFQATPELGLYAMTNLANLYIHKPDMYPLDSTFFGADFIPLTVGGLFAVSEMLDVTAAIGFGDLKNSAGDSFLFNVGARAHI